MRKPCRYVFTKILAKEGMKEGSSESPICTYTLENIVFHVKNGNGNEICTKLRLGNGIFLPIPSPIRTVVIVTLSDLFIIVFQCVSIATDSSTSEIRKTCATLLRKLIVESSTYFPNLENHKLYSLWYFRIPIMTTRLNTTDDWQSRLVIGTMHSLYNAVLAQF